MTIIADREPAGPAGVSVGGPADALVDGRSAESRPFEGRPAHDGGDLSAMDPAATAATARRAMIDSQLRTSGINEPWVLAAMLRVPREDYVPAAMRGAAYIDRAIPLDGGGALAAPVVHGAMLTEAAPRPGDRALLVGDGAGYLAALLRPLVASLDSVAPAADLAVGDGPYTLIVVDGAAEALPPVLTAALADDGRLVTGLVDRGVTRLAAGRKVTGTGNGAATLALLPLAEMGIPVLSELAAPKRWRF